MIEPLTELVVRAFGPVQIVGEELADLLGAGVVEVGIFGSWAARYRGEHGPDPADIDVLVVKAARRLDGGLLLVPRVQSMDQSTVAMMLNLHRDGPAKRPTEVLG